VAENLLNQEHNFINTSRFSREPPLFVY